MSLDYQSDAIVIGAGIAGLSTAYELLSAGKRVLLLDRDTDARIGGMANDAFGGMHLVNTPYQTRNGIKDSESLAWDDWCAAAEYQPHHRWPKAWGQHYIEHCRTDVYEWLRAFGIRYFPIVHWVERGDFGFGDGYRGNSVPRYHIVWGTGWELGQTVKRAVLEHPNASLLSVCTEHKVESLSEQQGRIVGCAGTNLRTGKSFAASAEHTIICSGGINGNQAKVKQHWDTDTYGAYPDNILSGCHPYADGHLHDEAAAFGASIKNLGWTWNYAAGVKHPEPEYDNHGLSIIPTRSALWVDALGNRIGPVPLVTGFDTHRLCQRVGRLPYQYSWQVMNWKIAAKELGVSGSHINTVFKNKSWLGVVKMGLQGTPSLIKMLNDSCDDVVSANTLPELVTAMNAMGNPADVNLSNLERDIRAYDAQMRTGGKFITDDQARRLQLLRQWRGDKPRTLKNQPILDDSAGPLVAMKLRIISRKSMGGFETDLNSRVLNDNGDVIDGLYAAGEAAGFGGAGMAGKRSLEGTFLSGGILTGRRAGQYIAKHS